MRAHKALLELMAGLEGVVTAIHADSSQHAIISSGAPNFLPEKLSQIMATGFSLFADLSEDQLDSREIRVDLDDIQLLYHLDDDGGIFALFVDREHDLDAISSGIQGFRHMPSQWIEKAVNLSTQKEENTADPSKSRYTDEHLIGEGGTAKVYRAYDIVLKREVALKRYTEAADETQDYRSELQSASLINHHNVVSTFDAGRDQKSRYMVMELIDGKNLQQTIEEKALPMERFCPLAQQALEAMAATHDGGLLHLDIKPANIMLSPACPQGLEHLKLIDYGRAQNLPKDHSDDCPRGSGLSGSIYFTSPEALKEEAVDPRTDLYSLGCVFYWMLSGRRPFEGDSSLAVMAAHLQHLVPDLAEVAPHIPRRLSTWVMSFLKESPHMRPETAEEALLTFSKRGFAH